MSGAEYANLIGTYVARRFGARGIKVYREIRVGKSIIGKNRTIDVFCICDVTKKAFAIECKFQDSEGTVDEKIPYTLDDLEAMPMAGCIAYAGKGFSSGVLHMLRASSRAAYCMPVADQVTSTAETKELDHLLAMHFGWWDVFVGNKQPVTSSGVAGASAVVASRVQRLDGDGRDERRQQDSAGADPERQRARQQGPGHEVAVPDGEPGHEGEVERLLE